VCKNSPREKKLIEEQEQDDILGHVITGDETWVYQYDPEMKQQSAQWKSADSP
jgi:hypothetical protein